MFVRIKQRDDKQYLMIVESRRAGARIEQVGLMIADRQFGSFELAVRGVWMLRESGEEGR